MERMNTGPPPPVGLATTSIGRYFILTLTSYHLYTHFLSLWSQCVIGVDGEEACDVDSLEEKTCDVDSLEEQMCDVDSFEEQTTNLNFQKMCPLLPRPECIYRYFSNLPITWRINRITKAYCDLRISEIY